MGTTTELFQYLVTQEEAWGDGLLEGAFNSLLEARFAWELALTRELMGPTVVA